MICCFNDGASLPIALQSLEQQTLPQDRFELVLVNDGSSDNTEQVALTCHNSNLRYIHNTTNLGLPASCNIALAEARGQYIIRLDADDRFARPILAKMVEAMRTTGADLILSDRLEHHSSMKTKYVELEGLNIFRWIACGTMMRRSKLMEIGGYRPLFWEEYDLYMRYLNASDQVPVYIPEALYHYTIRQGSMTSDPKRVQDGWQELRQNWPNSELIKFGAMMKYAG